MNYIIRKKERKDCEAVAHVVTVSWNETYRGIVSDKFLDELYKNEKERADNSFKKFNEEDNHEYVLEVDNNVVGFVNVGISDEYDNCGEIHAIYILNKYRGHGFGKELINAGIMELKNMNCNNMIVGCLVGNPSNDFYKYLGGKFIKTRIFNRLQLLENVYYFEKI